MNAAGFLIAIVTLAIVFQCRVLSIPHPSVLAAVCNIGSLVLLFIASWRACRIDRGLGIFGFAALVFTVFVLPIFFPVY